MKKKKLKKAKKTLSRKKEFVKHFFELKNIMEQKMFKNKNPKKIAKYDKELDFIDLTINRTLGDIKEYSDFLQANDPNYIKDVAE
jgi:hypothetical protein